MCKKGGKTDIFRVSAGILGATPNADKQPKSLLTNEGRPDFCVYRV